MGKIILIDMNKGKVEGSFGPFDTRSEASRYASALDFYYGDDYEENKKPPIYTHSGLTKKGWVVIELEDVDWEQFTK